jgi:predicted transcriptional regulator
MTSDDISLKVALLQATANISAAYITAHSVGIEALDELVDTVYRSLEQTQEFVGLNAQGEKPQIDIASSITPEYLVCLEDGKKLKMLKRYLKTNFNMTPEEYRKRWNLPSDYPMVAPNYAKKRSELAKDIGLGKQTLRQRKQVVINKFKNGALPAGKGKLRILKSTDIMTTRSINH